MFTAILSQGPMILYQPATSHFDSIERPNCSECGSTTHLFGIEAADRFGYALLTFVVPKLRTHRNCGREKRAYDLMRLPGFHFG